MFKKIFFPLLGLLLLAIVVWLGINSAKDSSFIVWFGLSSAILAPLALASIGYAFKPDERKIYQDLSKVAKIAQIDELIEKAQTLEEKVELLKQERAHLTDIVKVEARRQMLVNSKKLLEKEIERISKEYSAIEEEIKLLDIRIEDSPAREELERIRKKIKQRKKGDIAVIRFGKREFSFDLHYDLLFPLGGMVSLILKLIEFLQNKFRKKGGSTP
jgi:hypothetical protein